MDLKILYLTCVPKEYGGKDNGGIATHSYQLIKNAVEFYKVGLYSDINKLKNLENVTLHSFNELRLIKFIKAILIMPFIKKTKLNKLKNLNLQDKLLVLYHYSKLSKIVNKYDVIHAHSLYKREITAISLMEKRPKLVITDHGFWQGNIERDLEIVRYNSSVADTIIYISDFARNMYEKYNLDISNIIKIQNPIMIDSLQSKKYSEIKKRLDIGDDKKVLFFSGVSESLKRKGLDLFLDSVCSNEYLRDKTISIIIADKDGFEYSQKYTEKCSLRVLNPLPYEEVANIYGISDVFVLPSRSESFGLVYIESLSYGVPVIGFDKVINEFKVNYGDVYIGEEYNPNNEDIKDLATKIQKVIRTKIEKEKIIKKTEQLYAWETLFEKFKNVYK